jgi:hypothetical protein
MAEAAEEREYPRRWEGERNHRHYLARTRPSPAERKKCSCCGRTVRRSWRTGLTWGSCYTCRYLKMIYGPNIKVKWVG